MASHEANRAVYVISVAAEIAGVHPQTLRIYERKGLLNPARTGGGSRRYSDADIEQLRQIQRLTEDGINLAGVAKILELESELNRTREAAAELHRQHQAAARQHQAELRAAEKEHRRDLVPVSKEVTVYRRRR